MFDLNWYYNKTVLLTGHTGFKGTWLCRILQNVGANVIGYSLDPPTIPSLFEYADLNSINSIIADIRDFAKLNSVFDMYQPEIVIHMAAQPIVRASYLDPRYTYETNVMGTVNICECIRTHNSVKSFVNVTTDKVYKNNEWLWGYRENEPLDGFDPYSNSKSCSELITHSYASSFFDSGIPACSTVRAGNVIGGGDYANDRIIPDCIRAVEKGNSIIVRNPNSVRPYQHVLEPLVVYLMIAMEQYSKPDLSGAYNVGPDDADCITTGELVELFCKEWGDGAKWYSQSDNGPHEANYLKLDCSKLKGIFGWSPKWHVSDAIKKIVEFSKQKSAGIPVPEIMDQQISAFLR